MSRRTRGDAKRPEDTVADARRVEGEALEPIRVVERELTRPDGTTVVVEVPVYPPFRLKERSAGRPPAPARKRGAPSLRRKTPRSSRNGKN